MRQRRLLKIVALAAAGVVPLRVATAGASFSLPPIPELRNAAATFEAENKDSGWSPRVEGYVFGKIAQAGLGARAIEVDCRTTICRVQVSQPRYAEVLQKLVNRLGLRPLSAFNLASADGVPTWLAYLQRDAGDAAELASPN